MYIFNSSIINCRLSTVYNRHNLIIILTNRKYRKLKIKKIRLVYIFNTSIINRRLTNVIDIN